MCVGGGRMSVTPSLVRFSNKEPLICELVDTKQTQCYCGFHYDGFKRVSDIERYIIFS